MKGPLEFVIDTQPEPAAINVFDTQRLRRYGPEEAFWKKTFMMQDLQLVK